MEVVERRRSSTTVGLRRTKSVRSSLRVVGARWRTAAANAAQNNNIPCPPTNQELEEPSTVKFISATQLPSPPVTPPPQKQKTSRTSWLPSFSYHQNKNLKTAPTGKTKEQHSKSTPNLGVAKVKETKPSRATWIQTLTYQHRQKTKPVPIPTIEEKPAQDSSPTRQRWVLGLTQEQMRSTKPTSLLSLAEENAKPKIASPRLSVSRCNSPENYIRQKSNSLSRSFPPTLEEFLDIQPVISSVGTQRRNSMWAVNSSNPESMLLFLFIRGLGSESNAIVMYHRRLAR